MSESSDQDDERDRDQDGKDDSDDDKKSKGNDGDDDKKDKGDDGDKGDSGGDSGGDGGDDNGDSSKGGGGGGGGNDDGGSSAGPDWFNDDGDSGGSRKSSDDDDNRSRSSDDREQKSEPKDTTQFQLVSDPADWNPDPKENEPEAKMDDTDWNAGDKSVSAQGFAGLDQNTQELFNGTYTPEEAPSVWAEQERQRQELARKKAASFNDGTMPPGFGPKGPEAQGGPIEPGNSGTAWGVPQPQAQGSQEVKTIYGQLEGNPSFAEIPREVRNLFIRQYGPDLAERIWNAQNKQNNPEQYSEMPPARSAAAPSPRALPPAPIKPSAALAPPARTPFRPPSASSRRPSGGSSGPKEPDTTPATGQYVQIGTNADGSPIMAILPGSGSFTPPPSGFAPMGRPAPAFYQPPPAPAQQANQPKPPPWWNPHHP